MLSVCLSENVSQINFKSPKSQQDSHPILLLIDPICELSYNFNLTTGFKEGNIINEMSLTNLLSNGQLFLW